MPRTSQNPDAVNAAITDFMNHDESTMRHPLSASIGKVIYDLRQIYRNGQGIDGEHAPAFDELYRPLKHTITRTLTKELQASGISAADIKAATDALFTHANERTTWLDNVTLYLPDNPDEPDETKQTYSEHKFVFTLKEVIWLAWQATQDHPRYTQHYTSKAEDKAVQAKERLAQAQADYPKHLLSLYECLQRIKQGICHQGIRNELIMILNHVFGLFKKLNDEYQSLRIIEDPTLEAHHFVGGMLYERFWDAFERSQDNRQALKKDLFDWMSTRNPGGMLKKLDPEQTIRQALYQHFIHHGNNPQTTVCGKDTTLPVIVDRLYQSLGFPSDTHRAPLLAQLNDILSAQAVPEQNACNNATQQFQIWLKSAFQFGNADHEALVQSFHAHHMTYQAFLQAAPTLILTGNLTTEAVDQWREQFTQYFAAITEAVPPPVASAETLTNLESLRRNIEKANSNSLVTPIETFFIDWQASIENDDPAVRRRLYRLLLDHPDKIVLDDDTLCALPRPLSHYALNRILLHGIINSPSSWTEAFAKAYEEAFQLTRWQFNEYETFGTQIHYSVQLRHYLFADQPAEEDKPARPDGLLLMAHQVQSAIEWYELSQRVDEKKLEQLYRPRAAVINRDLLTYLGNLDNLPDDGNLVVLHSLPPMLRENFIKTHWKTIVPRLFCGNDVITLLRALPEERRSPFLKRHEKQLMELFDDADDFYSLLLALPENRRSAVFKKYALTLMYPNDAETLTDCLHALPYAERTAVFAAHETEYLQFAQKSADLADLLDALPNREAYFLAHVDDFLARLADGSDLSTVLNALPGIDRLDFFAEHAQVLLPKFKNGLQLAHFIKLLPSTEPLNFFNEYAVSWLSILETGWDIRHVLRTFTAEQVTLWIATYSDHLLNKVREMQGISTALSECSHTTRSAFLVWHLDRLLQAVQKCDDVWSLLAIAPPDDRAGFLAEHEEVLLRPITNGTELAKVLAQLKQTESYAFLSCHEALVKSLCHHGTDVAALLSALPLKKRIAYFERHQTHFMPLMKTVDDLTALMAAWPDPDKIQLFSRYQECFLPLIKNIEDFRKLLDYIETMSQPKMQLYSPYAAFFANLAQDAASLQELLLCFSENKRWRVFRKHAQLFLSQINNGVDFAVILSVFSQADRRTAFERYMPSWCQRIKNMTGYVSILKQLTPETCLRWIKHHWQLISQHLNTASDLACLLSAIPANKQESFWRQHVTTFRGLIHHSSDLATVLSAFPETNRWPFLRKPLRLRSLQKHFSSIDDVQRIAMLLVDYEQRHELFDQFKPLCHTGRMTLTQLCSYLQSIDWDRAKRHLKRYQTDWIKSIESPSDVAALLKALPASVHNTVFKTCARHVLPLIQNAKDLFLILHAMNTDAGAVFKAYEPQLTPWLKTGDDWSELLTTFSRTDAIQWIEDNEATLIPKLKTGKAIASTLGYLPIRQSLLLFQKHRKHFWRHIHDIGTVTKILECMSADIQEIFISTHESAIFSKLEPIDRIVELIAALKPEIQAPFMTQHLDKVSQFRQGYSFGILMNTMNLASHKREFFKEHEELITARIKDGHDLAICLQALPETLREPWLNKHPHLLRIPVYDANDIAILYAGMIKTTCIRSPEALKAYQSAMLQQIRDAEGLETFLHKLDGNMRMDCLIQHAAILLPHITTALQFETITCMMSTALLPPQRLLSHMPQHFIDVADFTSPLPRHFYPDEMLQELRQIQAFRRDPAHAFAEQPLSFMAWLKQTLPLPCPILHRHEQWLSLLDAAATAALSAGELDAKDLMHAMQIQVRLAYAASGQCHAPEENAAAMAVTAISIKNPKTLPVQYHELIAKVLWEQPGLLMKQLALEHWVQAAQKGYRHLSPMVALRRAELSALVATQEGMMALERDGLFRQRREREEVRPVMEANKRVRFNN